MKEKLESYLKYMLKQKGFVQYCLSDYKGKVMVAKEGGSKTDLKYWTERLQEREEELKMVNDIIDYLQLEHYRYV